MKESVDDKIELGQIIATHFSTLLRCLDPTKELLGKLLSVAFVKDRISVIEQQATLDDKNYALLRALQEVPDDLQETVMIEFIAALRSCGQEHVANIFRPESDKVPMSDDHRDMIVKQAAELCNFLDPENGLLDKLFSSGVITSSDVDRIRNKFGFHNVAEELLSTIVRKSDDAFQALIDSLHETGQPHVVFILTGEGDSRPLSKDDRKKLREKRECLIKRICTPGLVSSLVSAGVLTSVDQQRVDGRPTENEKCEILLDLIARKSQTDFHRFIDALQQCEQAHVAKYLWGPEALAIDVNVKDPEVDVKNLEREIREAMQETLADDETGSNNLRRFYGVGWSEDAVVVERFQATASVVEEKSGKYLRLHVIIAGAFIPI